MFDHRAANRRICARNRRIIDLAKQRPCKDCGHAYAPYVMDFDHRDPSQKLFSVGDNGTRSIEALLAEIEKCDVVCANCHREREHTKRRAIRPTP